MLWELFSFNPPSLKLYVDLCAWSQFLSEILINNPGMIDELLDSLVLNQPRTAEELRQELTDLCRGAADPEPILHSFQDKELLRIGVRDILGKDTIQATTAALSDLAETHPGADSPRSNRRRCEALRHSLSGRRAAQPGKPSRYALAGLGKLGGREMSYHSDLDLILVYEGDGRTGPPPGANRFDRFELTDNFHFFTELAQRIIKVTSFLGPMGRLYQVDMRLRPTGKSGSLVIPLTRVPPLLRGRRRQALGAASADPGPRRLRRCRLCRRSHGRGRARGLRLGLAAAPGRRDPEMRERLEASRSERDLKRGFGGIVDVEFLVQLFQIKYGHDLPALRTTNTWEALEVLRSNRLLTEWTTQQSWPATTSCGWSKAGCASSTTSPWMNYRRRPKTWRSWPAGSALKPVRQGVRDTSSWPSLSVIPRRHGSCSCVPWPRSARKRGRSRSRYLPEPRSVVWIPWLISLAALESVCQRLPVRMAGAAGACTATLCWPFTASN